MRLVAVAAKEAPPRAYYRHKVRMFACGACGSRFRDALFLPHPDGYPVKRGGNFAVFALCGCGERIGYAELGAPGKTLPLDRVFWGKELKRIWFESLFPEIHGRVPSRFEDVKAALFAVADSLLSPRSRPLNWIDEVKVTLLGHHLRKIDYSDIPNKLVSLRSFKIAFEEWDKK